MPRQRLRDLRMHSAGGKVADEGVPQGVKVSLSLGVIGVGKEIRFLTALSLLVVLCLFNPFCPCRIQVGPDHLGYMLARWNGERATVRLLILQMYGQQLDGIRPKRQRAFPPILAVRRGYGDGRLITAEAERSW
jgi:hypothetical protein